MQNLSEYLSTTKLFSQQEKREDFVFSSDQTEMELLFRHFPGIK